MLYTTKTDVIDQFIIPTLGEFVADYDLDGIFEDAFEYDTTNRCFTQTAYDDDYWEAVKQNAWAVVDF